MQFEQSETRTMLADTLRRWLAENYDISRRNSAAYDAPYHWPEGWRGLAELGVLFALADEHSGGMGGGGFDITTVFQEIGRALCPEPLLGAAMAAPLLKAAGKPLDDLLSGETRYAVAIGEIDAPYGLDDLETTARNGKISGRKSMVYGGGLADVLLVAARNDDGGMGLYEVKTADADVTDFAMIDGGNAAEVMLEETPAILLVKNAKLPLGLALDHGAVALCAEAVGAMETVLAMLIDYLGTRKQFGRRIGDFQVLQHRAVDLGIEIEQARSITILAASRLGEAGGSRTVSMAKNLVGRVARQVSEEAIQMHGGIAMTWEYPVSHYAKRLVMIDAQLGDADWHLERVMAAYG